MNPVIVGTGSRQRAASHCGKGEKQYEESKVGFFHDGFCNFYFRAILKCYSISDKLHVVFLIEGESVNV